MKIYVRQVNGKRCQLEIDPVATISELKESVHEETGTPKDRQRLIYGGKPLLEVHTSTAPTKNLRDYHILPGATINLLVNEPIRTLGPVDHQAFPTDESVKTTTREWKARAEQGSFDEDLHIIDPQTHYHRLEQLESEVVRRSEFFRSKGNYSLLSELNLRSVENSEVTNIPPSLKSLLNKMTPVRMLSRVRSISASIDHDFNVCTASYASSHDPVLGRAFPAAKADSSIFR